MVPGLISMAPVTADLGWDLLQSLAIFILCVFVGLVLFLITLGMNFLSQKVTRRFREVYE